MIEATRMNLVLNFFKSLSHHVYVKLITNNIHTEDTCSDRWVKQRVAVCYTRDVT